MISLRSVCLRLSVSGHHLFILSPGGGRGGLSAHSSIVITRVCFKFKLIVIHQPGLNSFNRHLVYIVSVLRVRYLDLKMIYQGVSS